MKTKICSIFGLAAFIIALALPVRTQAQVAVLNGFSHVVVFTVDGYAANRSALADFPVLVRISEAGISGFDYDDMTSPTTGDDLCFVATDGTPLAFDIDTWDPSGTSLVWVRLPSMAKGSQFVMAYGSSASGKTVCSANAFAGYTGVWHMNEADAGVTTIHDATTNALDGTTVSTSSSKTDGKVGRARFITSNKNNTAGQPYDSGVTVTLTNSAEKLAAVDALVPEFTASFWIRPQSDAQWWYFISRKTSDAEPGWGLQNGSTQNNSSQANFKTFRAYGGDENESSCLSLYGVDALVKQKWVKVDAVWMADKRFLLYVDGQKASEGTLANAAANTATPLDLSLGGAMAPLSASNKNGRGVYGDMDEVRLHAGAMTADWIAADYATQTDEAFLSASAVTVTDAIAFWFDDDGVTPLSPAFTAVPDGTRPVRADPAKSTVFYDFAFQGWTPVGGDGTVYAASELPVQTTGSIASYKAVWQTTLSDRLPQGFSRGVTFRVDGYDASRSMLTDFPVLVRISEAGISGFDYDDLMFSSTGDDICFIAEDGTPLAFEIDTWNTAGESLVWVKLPSMQNGTEFAMFYRSSQSGKTVCSANPFSNYVGVWHLGETGSGNVSTKVFDSSGNGLTGTATGSKCLSVAASEGVLGGSWRFNDEYNRNNSGIIVDLTDSTKLDAVNALGTDFTVSFWMKPYGTIGKKEGVSWNALIGRKTDGNSNFWGLQLDEDPKNLRIFGANGSNKVSAKTYSYTQNNWFKIDVAFYKDASNKGKYCYYVNGGGHDLNKALSDDKAAAQGTGPLGIGNFTSLSAERCFWGAMDEVRLICGTNSADRVAADYATVATPSFLVASQVTEFEEKPKPVIGHTISDIGAAFVQFSGSVSALGGTATSAAILVKVWPTTGSEPSGWTTITNNLGAGAAFTAILTGLEPLSGYMYLIKAVNDLADPYDSDVATGTFTTSGVGDAGTGGAVERQLDEFVHVFTVGERGQAVYKFTPPADVSTVDALVVAGGGPGGYHAGGGGGAGGLIYAEAVQISGGETYAITIGTGGVASASATVYGSNGGNSSIVGPSVNLVAVGGGAGGNGRLNNQDMTRAGVAGGSGGGSSWTGKSAGAGTANQGNAGGTTVSTGGAADHAGGGGGAAGAGGSVAQATGAQSSGAGGNGREIAITGEPVYYAGGGGGGGVKSFVNESYGSAGAGGAGGGGMGGQETATTDTAVAENGTDGLGGGGGGGSAVTGMEKGGNGGNGVVIIRYGAGGDGDGVTAPTISLTGLTYADKDNTTGAATVTYRVGWAGFGHDRADVLAIWGYSEDDLDNTNAVASAAIGQGTGSFTLTRVNKTVYVRLVATNATDSGTSPEIKSVVLTDPRAPVGEMTSATPDATRAQFAASVTGFGDGEGSLTGEFQICGDRFFDAGTYTSFPASETLTDVGPLTGSATGLSPNTVYWVRAAFVKVIGNDAHTYETAPISFTTNPAGVLFLIY